MKSLGFIETSGVTAAVEALDVLCKTAAVEFVTWERKLGGRLVTVIVQGEVSAVSQAVETAAEYLIRNNHMCVQAVIPRPHEEIVRMVQLSASRING